jgi:hypothetical protein
MIRDPRLPSREWARHCAHGLDSQYLQRALRLAGISRLEMDVPPFPTPETFARLPLPTGVHLPYAVVAKGRMCRIGSMSQQGPERFAPGRKCRKECLRLSATMSRSESTSDRHTVQFGNTILSQHSHDMSEVIVAAVAAGHITRLIAPGDLL